MKWILSIALLFGVCLTAEARPHLKGRVRGWLHRRPHVTQRQWGVKHTAQPPCKCCGDNCKCKPKCECPK